MSEQVLVQFSIDKNLRQEVVKLPEPSRAETWQAFEELRRQAADVPEMSLDEINEEIATVRAERRRRS